MKFCFGKIILDIRYNHGFVNIAKNITALSALYVKNSLFSNPELSGMLAATDSIKNKAFIILLGFGF
ncbi:MAG: hypothetical protein JSV88_25880 [Candidatus Aminicenantes bacterium]|nr:MAG: hypothetical protein JSV88_25880 [Candidatus Aminicenantes bacterium]